ncbi:protein transport protein sec1 [Acrasis kona]|uniref:Protein transport protein sec1 n=1 Tax=Acrasis kona TaxID=1008807 RepID=A0AAW2Z778_9EUKA
MSSSRADREDRKDREERRERKKSSKTGAESPREEKKSSRDREEKKSRSKEPKEEKKRSKKERKEVPTDNIREVVKVRLLDMFEQLPGDDDKMWKLLILDSHTTSIISAACRVRDLVQKNITLLEFLEKGRQPFPQMSGVYFIAPEEASVQLFIKDFEDPAKPKYHSAHLFFSSRVSSKIMKMIGASKAGTRVKTLVEVNVDFLAIEQKVFNLNIANDLRLGFASTNDERKRFAENVAHKLFTFCMTYGEQPYIRHNASSNLSSTVASLLSDKLEKDGEDLKQNSVMLIVDRGEDPLVPVLHDFYYQAMAFDLLKIDEDCIYSTMVEDKEKKTKKEKKVILDEYDPIWQTHRHTHYGDLGTIIKKDFDAFMEEHKDINSKDRDKLKEGSNLQNMMRKLPQYREKIDQYTLHINITKELLNQFRSQHLSDVGLEEQNMAVGQDQDGKKLQNVMTTISSLLRKDDISQENKLRLVIIYLITQGGLSDEKRANLITKAGLQKYTDTIENLANLGVQLNKSTSIAGKISSLLGGDKKKKSDVDAFILSRYIPRLKQLAEDALEDKLSSSEYPYVNPPSSSFKLSKAKGSSSAGKASEDSGSGKSSKGGPSWDRIGSSKSESGSSSKEVKDRQKTKLILFVIGGVTHPEMRTAYELDKEYKMDVLCGGTSVLTYDRFIEKLENMKGGSSKKKSRVEDSDSDLSSDDE